jgi:hypothetical protein
LAEMHNFCGTTEVQRLSQRKKRTYVPEFHDSELIWFVYKSLPRIHYQNPLRTVRRRPPNLKVRTYNLKLKTATAYLVSL